VDGDGRRPVAAASSLVAAGKKLTKLLGARRIFFVDFLVGLLEGLGPCRILRARFPPTQQWVNEWATSIGTGVGLKK
jgi:hypothetical protein